MTTWKFGNYDLSSFGAITLMDDYLDIPDTRGSNQVIPYQHGEIFVQKYFEARTLQFGIVIAGATLPIMEGLLEEFKKLIAPRTQQTLTQILANGTSRTALAIAERAMSTSRPAPNVTKLTLELNLAKPFFRDSTVIPDNTTTISSSPKAMTVTNPGSVEERDPTITIDGPFSTITITNTTNSTAVTYTGAIGASENVVIATAATGEYTAVLSAGSLNVIGNVTHSGSTALLVLEPGINTLSITRTGGDNSGTVKISFYAPYI